jgi:hypothetical protein
MAPEDHFSGNPDLIQLCRIRHDASFHSPPKIPFRDDKKSADGYKSLQENSIIYPPSRVYEKFR